MTSLHEMFRLGKIGSEDRINVSIHRCDPAEDFTEPLCILQFTFPGGSSQSVMLSSDELKTLSKELIKFTKGF